MAGTERHGQVGDETVHRLTAAVRHHRAPVGAVGQVHRRHGLGQGADLVELDQHRVGGVLVDAALNAFHVGDEQVVPHQFEFPAQFAVEQFPARPVVFRQTVFQHQERIFGGPIGVHRHHLGGIHLAAFGAQVVKAVLIEAAGGGVEGDHHIVAGAVARLFDGLDDQVHGVRVAFQHRRKAALVADADGITAVLEHFLQGMVDLAAPAQGLGEAGRAHRGDHEFL